MDVTGPRSKCEGWCVLFWNCVLPHFKLGILYSWTQDLLKRYTFFPVNEKTKTILPTVPFLFYEIPTSHWHTKWTSTCKASVHNEVNDWVVRSECFSLWIWTSSITFSSLLLSCLPKVCLLLLCTYYIKLWFIITHKGQNYHSCTCSRSWSYFTVNNKLFL